MQIPFQLGSTSAAQPSAPFGVTYLDRSRLGEALADAQVMTVIRYGSSASDPNDDPRLCSVNLPEFDGDKTLEVWRSREPVHTGIENDIRFASNDAMLFAHIIVDESHYPDLDVATYSTYCKIFGFIRAQGYPYLLRVWNYFPDLHGEHHGLKRYKAFCQGRYLALERKIGFEHTLPAACVLGTGSPGLLIYFLAAKHRGMAVDYPREPGDFPYPKHFGHKSLPLSRAVLKRWGDKDSHLYISGTASLVGHEVLHSRDAGAQLKETLNDVEALVDAARREIKGSLKLSLLKIYLREDLNIEQLRDGITRRLGENVSTLFLNADICRNNLLLEIEALCD